ncbi:YchJ family protein [Corynebacterium stercoris]|uniref:YchJ family protein n=1 Tax=Corynebacterium stercoris TaxID=2943490 RepID=UPI0021137CB7|nr:YchJ family metal-binding protein [Corynebacterium stercoris]
MVAAVSGACPCGLGLPYAQCCGKYHAGVRAGGGPFAPTADALMRSRYSAFAVGDAEYLLATWAEETRPRELAVAPTGEPFTRLVVLDKARGGVFDAEGVVEFAAFYPGGVQRERSRFVRRDGRWFYVDGDVQ